MKIWNESAPAAVDVLPTGDVELRIRIFSDSESVARLTPEVAERISHELAFAARMARRMIAWRDLGRDMVAPCGESDA